MHFRIFAFNDEAIIMNGDVKWIIKEIRNSENVLYIGTKVGLPFTKNNE
jgi:hypothetical protein